MKPKSTVKSIAIFLAMLLLNYFNTIADCGSSGTPISVSGNVNWSTIAALTTCDAQLTTNNGVYNGNVYINISICQIQQQLILILT